MEETNPTDCPQDFPAVIRGAVSKWKMVSYTKEDWCNVFKDKVLSFRRGLKAFSRTPYWEGLCESKEMTLQEFFDHSTSNSDHWLYFDYKYLRDVFPENETFLHEIRWADLNLMDLDPKETALWIGNSGAHTPCHKDTYGCNVVAQLFGRKLWILSPPNEDERLGAVRIPYEESSVYSSLNFFTPNNNLLKIGTAYKVILSPGDVLYVPRHWWHYVENLEPAISTNIWLPLPEDHESRLEESLVQHYVSTLCQDLAVEQCKEILNPNEYRLIGEPCTLTTIEKCLEEYKKHKDEQRIENGVWNLIRGGNDQLEKLDINIYIWERSQTYGYSPGVPEYNFQSEDRVRLAKALINAYCHSENISRMKNLLLKQ